MRLLLALIGLLPFALSGQQASFSIRGQVVDASSEEPLAFANIYLEELGFGAQADDGGYFRLSRANSSAIDEESDFDRSNEKIPGGEYHLRISHVGCEPQRLFLKLERDTFLLIELIHHAELLNEVVIQGQQGEVTTQNSVSISLEEIGLRGTSDLAGLLDNLNGISSLRNGSTIGKPIIHGLFGNRIAILNNGIAQSGQQWGNDHAPEIDPFVASHLSVIKGVSTLQFGGSSLGGVVLVEPGSIQDEPHLHGHLHYLYQSNGRGHALNTRLEQAGSFVNWRFIGTVRHQGDQRTPDYFLKNTGKREYNGALQLEKKFDDQWSGNLYYSLFNTELGILRGSHIGNLTDLGAAMVRDEPLFTTNEFTYEIGAPRQKVSHHLLKIVARQSLANEGSLRFTYSFQINDRREFDVRRGGRTNIPALDLVQTTHYGSADYNKQVGRYGLLRAGVQFNYVDNDNQPGTGVLPLIPNYQSWRPGAYLSYLHERAEWQFEFGGRYDYIRLGVNTITREVPREPIEYDYNFHRFSLVAGSRYQVNPELRLSANLGFTRRPPEANELHSFGLHQGVSGIEEGNLDLKAENSLKATLGVDWSPGRALFVQLLTYAQPISDFIFLEPEARFRQTVRGAFPVFVYRQTDALLTGADLMVSVEPSERLKLVTQYSYLRGQDVDNGNPLIFMPPNRLSSSLQLALSDGESFKNSKLEIRGEYTFRQDRFTPNLDFQPPPDGFFLVTTSGSTHLNIGRQSLHLSLRLENVFNVRYRDYLNRLRYFADELGRNLVAGVKWEF
ncbi:MAG: TonB-dependent receptor [Bacteroidota bacterium]